MLEEVKRYVLAGKYFEASWNRFLLENFPGVDEQEAAVELGQWCRENGLDPELVPRRVNNRMEIRLLLTPL